MSGGSKYVLELEGVSKSFGPVVANDDVDVVIRPGTVHAVVGENGAGKSTLMKLAYGQIRADKGRIAIKGEEVVLAKHSPRLSIARGLGMVHQHFMLANPLSVVENVVLGQEPRKGFALDLKTPADELSRLSERFGLEVDPNAVVEELSVGQQQRVEILKVLWQGCDILILDEPTAVLTPGEVRQLFSVLRGLVAEGTTVALITHKLDEVAELADEITVMRRGRVVDSLSGDASVEDIASAMVGRPVLLEIDKSRPDGAEVGGNVLEVRGVSVSGRAGLTAVHDASLEVAAGEIVGIAGVQGNGQSELFEAVAGLRPVSAGQIVVDGVNVTARSVAGRLTAGLAHVPEDRHHRGVILDFDIAENAILGRHREFDTTLGLDRGAVRRHTDTCITDFDIRPSDPDAMMRGLSGGNQQKVVMARELGRPKASVLLCGQPTRGVDVGAIELIHKRVLAARDQGLGVLLVSAELSELRGLADRVLVFYKGKIVAELDADELAADDSIERMGQLMTGAVPAEEVAS